MKTIINSSKAPSPIGPYNQAVRIKDMLYVSGQIAINPETGNLITASVEDETRQVLRNIQAILDEAGLTFDSVVKTTIFLSDMAHFAIVNELYGTCFAGDYPARETVAVAGLPKGANVEISVIAHID